VRGVICVGELQQRQGKAARWFPTVAFGVPGSATMAILLGAFLIHGLVPGPDMLTKNLDITYGDGVVGGIGQHPRRGACATPSARQFAKLSILRFSLILPAVLGIIYIGAFEATRQWGDLYSLLNLRPDRLDHEAVQVAAAPAHPGRRARRHHRALPCFISVERYGISWFRAPGGGHPVHHRHHRTGAAVPAGRPHPRRRQEDVHQLPGAQVSTSRSCFTMFVITVLGAACAMGASAGTSAPRSSRSLSATVALLAAGFSLFQRLVPQNPSQRSEAWPSRPWPRVRGADLELRSRGPPPSIAGPGGITAQCGGGRGSEDPHGPDLRKPPQPAGRAHHQAGRRGFLRLSPRLHGGDVGHRPDPDGLRVSWSSSCATRTASAGSSSSSMRRCW